MEGKVETRRNLLVFLTPVLIFSVLFLAYPLLYSGYLSLTHYNYATDEAPQFIGFQGYIETFQDPLFHVALVNQVKFTIPYFILTFMLSLAIAIVISNLIRGITFFQILFSLPMIIPLSLVGIMFEWILFPDFGIFNHLLRVLGIASWNIKWYSDPRLAIYCLAIAQAWKMVGFTVLILVAGLQTIPKALREAAQIDGVNFFEELWYIIIPNLKPSLFICTTWILINSLKVFDLPRVVTEGGPGTSTVTLYFYSWKLGFEQLLMGRASQVAYITAAIILLFSWGLNRLFRHEPAKRG